MLSQTRVRQDACQKSIKNDVTRVPVARQGLILGEDKATASKKHFKRLPGPPAPISDQQKYKQIRKTNLKLIVKYGVSGMGGAL